MTKHDAALVQNRLVDLFVRDYFIEKGGRLTEQPDEW